jgi:hypothetical protein
MLKSEEKSIKGDRWLFDGLDDFLGKEISYQKGFSLFP